MQHISNGRSGGSTGSRPPVLLQHGLLMEAITWLLSPPDQSLALLLADNGFDVWLTSTRGTKYSQGHTSLSTNDAAYWNWSWDELVAYDLPATFQYVNVQTGQKLHYVGHSLGTLIALNAFSKGQFVGMLRSAAPLSPITYVLGSKDSSGVHYYFYQIFRDKAEATALERKRKGLGDGRVGIFSSLVVVALSR